MPIARCTQDTKKKQLVTRSSLQRLRCCVCHLQHEHAMKAPYRVRQFLGQKYTRRYNTTGLMLFPKKALSRFFYFWVVLHLPFSILSICLWSVRRRYFTSCLLMSILAGATHVRARHELLPQLSRHSLWTCMRLSWR